MNHIMLPVLAGIALLTGCSGGKSTFECDATADDQCMTMLQANEKAGAMTTSKQGGGVKQLPAVAKRPLNTGATPQAAPPGRIIPPAAASSSGMLTTARAGAATHSTPVTYSTPLRPVVRPVRLAEGTGKVWIAAWVDKDGAYHADNMISLVTRPGEWN